MYIFLIIILGVVLRLINIDKPEGLWNDEYVSWFVASTPFFKGFWQEVLKQCHMPLYYFYLKPFSCCSDLILRLTSLVPSVISIFIMYLVGKEYSKKIGYGTALLTATLAFLIYYAQEVRFYSLLFLLTSISLLFTIKIVKADILNKKLLVGYSVSLFLILFTHILGGIYVGLNLLYIAYKKKKVKANIILGIIIIFLSFLPLLLNILKMLPSSQWWGSFSYTNIMFLFSDYFSPILTNNINAPKTFYYSKHLMFIALITIPTLIAFAGLILGAKKEKGLAYIALGTIFLMSILAIAGKLMFITKYSIEIFPILILLTVIGFEQVTNKRISALLLSSLISFHLFAIFTPYYPAKIFRAEGNKLVGDILNKEKKDVVIYTYYDQNRFKRYLSNDNSKSLHISKINRFDYLDKPQRILEQIAIGERVSVVFLDSVSFIPQNWIETAKSKNMPEMFISFSIIRNAIIQELEKSFNDFSVERNGSWTIITATKKK